MTGGRDDGDHPHQPRGRTGFDPHQRQQTLRLTTTSITPTPTPTTATAKGKQKAVVYVEAVQNSPRSSSRDEADKNDEDDDDANDTVGSLLAEIADVLTGALRRLMFADKRHWGSDEFEQVRALEDTLDEAKADFQELGPLLKRSFYYENDRRRTCTFLILWTFDLRLQPWGKGRLG